MEWNFVRFSPFFEFRCLSLRFHNQFCHNKGQAGWDQGYHIGWIYWHSGSLLHDEWTVQDHKCYEGLRGVFVQGKVPHLHKTDKRMLKKGEEGSLSPTQGFIKYSLLYTSLWMKVLVANLGKSNNKCCDASLGLNRLHYNSCSISTFHI